MSLFNLKIKANKNKNRKIYLYIHMFKFSDSRQMTHDHRNLEPCPKMVDWNPYIQRINFKSKNLKILKMHIIFGTPWTVHRSRRRHKRRTNFVRTMQMYRTASDKTRIHYELQCTFCVHHATQYTFETFDATRPITRVWNWQFVREDILSLNIL